MIQTPSPKESVLGIDTGDVCHLVWGDFVEDTIYGKPVERVVGCKTVAVEKLLREVEKIVQTYGVVCIICDAMPYKPTAKALAGMYPYLVHLRYYLPGKNLRMDKEDDLDETYQTVAWDREDSLDEVTDLFGNNDIILPGLIGDQDTPGSDFAGELLHGSKKESFLHRSGKMMYRYKTGKGGDYLMALCNMHIGLVLVKKMGVGRTTKPEYVTVVGRKIRSILGKKNAAGWRKKRGLMY